MHGYQWCSSVSLHPYLCQSISRSVYVHPSVIRPSLCPHVLGILSYVHSHWNWNYNFLPLLLHLLEAEQSSTVCVSMAVSGCLCRDSPTAHLVERLGAVDTNKGVFIVWSRITVLRPGARPTTTCQLNYNWQVSTDECTTFAPEHTPEHLSLPKTRCRTFAPTWKKGRTFAPPLKCVGHLPSRKEWADNCPSLKQDG